jgi:hypoxanthine phosphoribosyltransferase
MNDDSLVDNGLMDDIAEILITAEELDNRVAELGAQISADYVDKNPILVGVLVRTITIPIDIDFIGITHYGSSTQTRGAVRFTKDLDICIEGRHVLFVEDVIDTGLSIHYILRNLKTREPASLQVCTLFDKPGTRLFDPEVAYTGFMLPDKFVVGYGLDYDERYRNLPFIGVLKEEAITQRRLPVGAQT